MAESKWFDKKGTGCGDFPVNDECPFGLFSVDSLFPKLLERLSSFDGTSSQNEMYIFSFNIKT